MVQDRAVATMAD